MSDPNKPRTPQERQHDEMLRKRKTRLEQREKESKQ